VAHAYPFDLARSAHGRWRELASECAEAGIAPPTELAHLEELVSTAYQASLLREEERLVTFRLLVSDPERLPERGGPPDGLHRLQFTRARPFTDHEIRRLSPAAKYHRALIGVRWDAEEARFVIWGLAQSGPRWLNSVHGGRGAAPSAPAHALVIRATGPGRLSLTVGDHSLAEIRGGRVGRTRLDVFESRWLPARFAGTRGELAAIHDDARRAAPSRWADLEPDVTRNVAQHMIRRVLATMRAAHHGGTIVFVPSACATELAEGSRWLQLKYAFADGEPRRRFRSLILDVMAALAEEGGSSGRASVGFREYDLSQSPHLALLEEAIAELSNLVAALADVDGAVVMTERFELVGFGGEITGDLPHVDHVRRAFDLEALETEIEPTDDVGTRHRSAYRLAAAVNDAIAIVVSQDGGVRFVTWHDGGVTYWEHVSLAPSDG
jgi:DisA bacterial checkpoint controller nucleotide-binding